MKKLLLTLATTLLIATPVYAQVAGKWAAEVQNPGGGPPAQVMLDLKVEGGKLTGTQTAGGAPPIEIQDGTISGSKISFLTRRNTQAGEVTLKNSGEVKGDDLALNREVVGANGAGAGGPPPLLLKRVK